MKTKKDWYTHFNAVKGTLETILYLLYNIDIIKETNEGLQINGELYLWNQLNECLEALNKFKFNEPKALFVVNYNLSGENDFIYCSSKEVTIYNCNVVPIITFELEYEDNSLDCVKKHINKSIMPIQL